MLGMCENFVPQLFKGLFISNINIYLTILILHLKKKKKIIN